MAFDLIAMTFSFAASSYPLNVINDVNKYRNKPTILRSLPSSSQFSSLQSSSLPIKTDQDTKNSSQSQKSNNTVNPTPCFRQVNTVGIIGGVSVLSTLIFLEKFVFWSSRDKRDPIPFVVCSDPQEAYESVAGSASSSCNDDIIASDQVRVMVDNLKSKRLFLEGGGARCIVMPCHLSHAWYDEISHGCKVSFLHVAECIARELNEARFRPLETGSGVKIGIIATEDTLTAGFYQEKLYDQGLEVILPDKSTMENIVNPAIHSLKRKDIKGARNLLRIAIQVLLVKGVNSVILASHELQNILPHDDPLAKKCVDPLDALARSAVRWAKSAKLHKRLFHDTI